MYEPKIHIFNERPGKDPEKPEANMDVKGQKLIVTRYVSDAYTTGTKRAPVRIGLTAT